MVSPEHTILRRPRLLEQIERGGAVTLVIAPAGYGKTSLLIQSARETSTPVCWLSLNEADRDLAVLLDDLLSALRQRFPNFTWKPDTVSPDAAAPLAEILAQLGPLVLILDDYHMLRNSGPVQDFMNRLVPALPPQLRLLISSRTPPDLPVTTLLAGGMLSALGAEVIRFQVAEVRSLLSGFGLELSEAEAAAITEEYNGWITGILLDTYPRWAQPDRKEGQPVSFPPDLTVESGFSRLAERLLDLLTPALQRFLLDASVLEKITASATAALGIGLVRLPATTERLIVQAQPGTAEPTWQLHPLWHDFLSQKLRTTDPGRWKELNQRAAEYYDANGDLAGAIRHGLAAEDYPTAIARMERAAVEWFMFGRAQTLIDWLDALPPTWQPFAPRLLQLAAKVSVDRSAFAQARTYLELAEPSLDGQAEQLTELHSLRGWIALRQGDLASAMKEAQRAIDVADSTSRRARAEAVRLLGNAYLAAGELEAAAESLSNALELYRAVGNLHDVANVLQDLAVVHRRQGRSASADAYFAEALSHRRALGAPGPLAALLNDIAYGHYYRGQIDQALDLYDEALLNSHRAGNRRVEAYITTGLADLWRDQAAWDHSGPLYESALILALEAAPDICEYLYAAQAISYLRQKAPRLAWLTLESAKKTVASRTGSVLRVVMGSTLVALGQLEAGLAQLELAVRDWDQAPDWELARAHLWLAAAYLQAGTADRTREELAQAFALTEQLQAQYMLSVELRYALPIVEFARRNRLAIPEVTSEPPGFALTSTSAGEQLAVFALGRSRIVRGGQEVAVAAWRSAIAREIFFYLLFRGPTSRDILAALFWPDAEPDKITANFHTLLRRMRSALGTQSVVFDGQYYRLGIEVWTDVTEFEGWISQARLLPRHEWRTQDLWQRAVDLVRGDFLADVSRNWVNPERERLREEYLEAMTNLAAYHGVHGDPLAAADWYRRALAVDPLREDLHRALIICLAEAGRPAQALAQYDRCRTILAAELGTTPSPETVALYQRLPGAGRRQASRSH